MGGKGRTYSTQGSEEMALRGHPWRGYARKVPTLLCLGPRRDLDGLDGFQAAALVANFKDEVSILVAGTPVRPLAIISLRAGTLRI